MRGIFFSIATIALAIIIETFVMNWRFVGGAAGIQIQRPPVTAPFDSYVKMLFFGRLYGCSCTTTTPTASSPTPPVRRPHWSARTRRTGQ